MKKRVLKQVAAYVECRWDADTALAVYRQAGKRLEELCRENSGNPKQVRAHTEGEIYPCISLYEALQKCGISKEEALEFLDKSWSQMAIPNAKKLGNVLKYFGLYRIYPAAFRKTAETKFGPKAGFQARFYECGIGRCKFDMTRCLYLETCRSLGCPELTKCFCHVDDINNGNLHPRLCWNRTQTMGEGAPFCDFDIFIQ